ncbi:MAG: hypothetical protein WDN06_08510 [Asticcacaulis sp.]
MDSPSGLAENADASALMVSDFISGLYRVDLAAGTMARLNAPDGGSLLGISSLSRYGDDLIAIENGFKPAKGAAPAYVARLADGGIGRGAAAVRQAVVAAVPGPGRWRPLPVRGAKPVGPIWTTRAIRSAIRPIRRSSARST